MENENKITGTFRNDRGATLELSAEDVEVLLTVLREDESPEALKLYGQIIDTLD